jgi:hypothetical protein
VTLEELLKVVLPFDEESDTSESGLDWWLEDPDRSFSDLDYGISDTIKTLAMETLVVILGL